jgi:hypothetical protein
MNRLVPVVLVLLILSGAFGFSTLYEYTLNQQKDAEILRLKTQLDDSSRKLAETQDNVTLLSNELNQTRSQVTQLRGQIADLQKQVAGLEGNVSKLQQQLKLKNYITIGLSFMWNPRLEAGIGLTYLEGYIDTIVNRMNLKIWDPLHIYFFVFHAESHDFVPPSVSCGYGYGYETWMNEPWDLYSGPNIPIGVVESIAYESSGAWGCTYAAKYPNRYFIAIYWGMGYASGSEALSNELLHVFGFSDAQIEQEKGFYTDTIPISWFPQIERAAKQFEMPLPPDYSF